MKLAEQRHAIVGESIDREDLPEWPLAVETPRKEVGLNLAQATGAGLR